jgi:hypothetical protein
VKRFLMGVLIACVIVGGRLVCTAEQPTCTGDRHYDGVGCCPVDPPNPPPVTTTTLPEGCDTCCPTPPPCPVVNCDGPDTTNVYNVTVNRCPSVVFPKYAPCRERQPGSKRHNGDVYYQGAYYKCPRGETPHRYFIPLVEG